MPHYSVFRVWNLHGFHVSLVLYCQAVHGIWERALQKKKDFRCNRQSRHLLPPERCDVVILFQEVPLTDGAAGLRACMRFVFETSVTKPVRDLVPFAARSGEEVCVFTLESAGIKRVGHSAQIAGLWIFFFLQSASPLKAPKPTTYWSYKYYPCSLKVCYISPWNFSNDLHTSIDSKSVQDLQYVLDGNRWAGSARLESLHRWTWCIFWFISVYGICWQWDKWENVASLVFKANCLETRS